MKTNNCSATAMVASHPDIATRIHVSSVLYSIVLLVAGIAAFASVCCMEERSSALCMGAMVAGAILILVGITRLFWKMRELVYLPTGSSMRSYSLFFAQNDLDDLTDMTKQGRFKEMAGLKCVPSGSVRLDVAVSKDRRFAVVHLLHYIPYTYTPATDVLYFKEEKAAEVADLVKTHHG